MTDYSIKLTLTRQERRELDRAARLVSLKTGPYARSMALAAARLAHVAPTPHPALPKAEGKVDVAHFHPSRIPPARPLPYVPTKCAECGLVDAHDPDCPVHPDYKEPA